MINYRLKIDFSGSKTLASDICFVSGDVKSSTLYFEFFDEGKRVDISGYTLSVRAKRSDGVVVASLGKIENNTAIFTPESNFYSVPGEMYMEVALSDASGKYATTKVIIAEVVEGLGEAAIDGVDNLNVYVTLLNEAVNAKEEAKIAAQTAKSVHPKIYDGEWWVYDSDEEKMVSSGITAEGYTPQKGIDYYTEEEKTELLDEVLQKSSTRYANVLKGSISESFISLNDVSPVTHNVECKVSGDGITPEATQVMVFGKNLIPYPFRSFIVTNSVISATDLGDGGILINGTPTATAYIILSNCRLGKSWITGVGKKFSANSYNENIKVSYDPSDKTTYVSIAAGTVCDNVIFYPQIEVGSKITEYEKGAPYQAYTPNADGIVNGMTSVAPYMNILCDTDGVTLDVVYNKDSNKVVKKIESDSKEQLSNALKGSVSGSAVGMVDVSPVEHELKVKVSDATAKVLKYGGNILDIDGREVVSFGTTLNTTQRKFTGKGIIKGFSYNNYYSPSNVTEFEKLKNGFMFSTKANQTPYGIGFDFKSAPNITYYASYEGNENFSNSTTIFYTEYDNDGNYLRGRYMSFTSDKKATKFTTGENTAWVVISFQCTEAETLTAFNNVYVGIDSFAEFEEYKEPVTYTPNADGTVEGITSFYPITTLLTDTMSANIEAQYNKDINKVIENLQNAIISLGGNV